MSDTRKIRVKKELPSDKPKPPSVATVGVDPAVPEGDRTVQINIAAEQAPVASGVSAVASAMRNLGISMNDIRDSFSRLGQRSGFATGGVIRSNDGREMRPDDFVRGLQYSFNDVQPNRGMFDGAGYRFAIHYDRDFRTLQGVVVLVIHKNGNREYNVESRVPREAVMGMRTPFDRDRVVAGVVSDLMDGLSDFFRREIASSLVSSSATRDMMENWMGRGRG